MVANVFQPLYDTALAELQAAGYNGGPMGQAWWQSAPIQGIINKYNTDASSLMQQVRQGANNPRSPYFGQYGATGLSIPTGDRAPDGKGFLGGLADVFNNPIPQIFAALATAGTYAPEALASLGLEGLGQAATALPSAIGSSVGGLTGVGNSVGSVFGAPTLGTDIGAGLSDFFAPVTDAIGSAGNGLSSWLGGTSSLSTGSGLTGDFAGGFQGFGDANPIASAAREAIAPTATAAAPAGDFISGYLPAGGVAAAGGGTAGGFFSSLGGGGSIIDASPLYGPIGSPAREFATGLATPDTGLTAFLNHPVESTISGVKDMFTPANLLGGAAKTGLSYLLTKDNGSAYDVGQTAANQQAANYQPFLTSGTQATNTLSDLYGLNGPAAAQAATQNWQNTPGYNFARDQALKAIDAGAAARGMLRSGNTIKAEAELGSNLADQYYNQYLQNLMGQQGVGLAGAQGVGQGKMNAAAINFANKQNQANRFNTMLGALSNFL